MAALLFMAAPWSLSKVLTKEELAAVLILLRSNVDAAEEPFDVIQGRVIDGYVRGANVYLDINGDGNPDAEEPSTTTGPGGRFELGLTPLQAQCKNLSPLVADVPVGAIDEESGEVDGAYRMVLPPGTTAIESNEEVFITPLTSMLWAEVLRLSKDEQFGLSCEDLEADPSKLGQLQELIDGAILTVVRNLNIPADRLLSDYIAIGDAQIAITAADIVRGLKATLAQQLLLEQQYPNGAVSAEVRLSTGGQERDPGLAPDELGWYLQTDIFTDELSFTTAVRLSDDLESQLYVVSYRETAPALTNATGVSYATTFELALEQVSPYLYSCLGLERIMVSQQNPAAGSTYEIEISNFIGGEELVENVDQCIASASTPSGRYIFIGERFNDPVEGVMNEGVQFSYAAPPYPYLDQVRNLKINPNVASKDEILAALLEQPWRFDEPADPDSQFSSKSLGIDDPLGFIDLNKTIFGSAYQDGLSANWRQNQDLADGTQDRLCALAPFDTPRECIDWQDQCPEGSGPHVIPGCGEPVDSISGRVIDGYVQGAEVFLDLNADGQKTPNEPSAMTAAQGAFTLNLNASQAACKNLSPIVADVPVGAVDEQSGEVTEAYQMVFPPGTTEISSDQEIFITPLTSILWAELNELARSGDIAGLSCESLADNPDALAELQFKIQQVINETVWAYNIAAEDLLTDYVASGDTETQRTAADIVKGLKMSLRERLALEQTFPDTGVSVVVKRVSGGEYFDPLLDDDLLGWYRRWTIQDGNLLRSGIIRLDDDLETELYLLFYKERYPPTLNEDGVNILYGREISLNSANEIGQYSCVGFETAAITAHYPNSLGTFEVAAENVTSKSVSGWEDCNESVHQQVNYGQNVFITERPRDRSDQVVLEQGYFAFSSTAPNGVPMPDTKGLALDPDAVTKEYMLSRLPAFNWRFYQSGDPNAEFTSMHFEYEDTNRILLEKFTDPVNKWRRVEHLSNNTRLEQEAYAPLDTPWQCIDWQSEYVVGEAFDILPDCPQQQFLEVLVSSGEGGTVLPNGSQQASAGTQLRLLVLPVDGRQMADSSSTDCGPDGSLHGLTYVSPTISDPCSINIEFELDGGTVPVDPTQVIDVLVDGQVGGLWEDGIAAFDRAHPEEPYAVCMGDGGEGCPSIGWGIVTDPERGSVLEVTYPDNADFAGLFFSSSATNDLSDFNNGWITFDVKVISAGSNAGFVMKIDCIFPCSSGDRYLGNIGNDGWQSVAVPLSDLVVGGLDLTQVNTGLVLFPPVGDTASVVYQLDNVKWVR